MYDCTRSGTSSLSWAHYACAAKIFLIAASECTGDPGAGERTGGGAGETQDTSQNKEAHAVPLLQGL